VEFQTLDCQVLK